MIDSELVRTFLPMRSLMAGNDPLPLSRNRSSIVPSDDAEKTTPRHVNVWGRWRIHAVDFTVRISYPALPLLAPASGRTSTTFVSGITRAPSFSAKYR